MTTWNITGDYNGGGSVTYIHLTEIEVANFVSSKLKFFVKIRIVRH